MLSFMHRSATVQRWGKSDCMVGHAWDITDMSIEFIISAKLELSLRGSKDWFLCEVDTAGIFGMSTADEEHLRANSQPPQRYQRRKSS